MSSPNADEREDSETTQSISRAAVGKWLAITFVGAVVLALAAGSTTPRARLLGLFSLGMGAFVAAASLWLLVKLGLQNDMRSWMVGWIVVLAVGVTLGATCQAWQIWKSSLKKQRAGFMAQINRMTDNSPDQKSAQQERAKLRLAFEEKTSFPSYLSHRLDAFSRQMGRNTVWEPPIPEVIFSIEQFLSAVAALFLSLVAYRTDPDSAHGEAS